MAAVSSLEVKEILPENIVTNMGKDGDVAASSTLCNPQ